MIKKACYAIGFLCIIFISCKKPAGHEETVPAAIHFEVLDKNGNSFIHSIKDTLTVSYMLNGSNVTNRLTIYKVQVSATDTTSINKYNGFLITDINPSNNQGYIVTPSGGSGVRDFILILNGKNIGTIHLDYWGYLSLGYPPPLSSLFTFDGIPVPGVSFSGVYSDGVNIVSYSSPTGDFIYLLKAN